MSQRTLPLKFSRALFVPTVTSLFSFTVRMKLAYEFWGFCVNGSNDLLNPGGFASTTPFNLPANFESGSSVLLASGSDGETSVGTQFFSSSIAGIFDESHVGKLLVTWVSGSESTDDSMYTITQYINSGVIRVDTSEGATPYLPANNEPYFTDRTGVNFRIIDLEATPSCPSGSYMVFEFASANDINEGQTNSQMKLGFQYPIPYEFRFHMSPSGSWNGTGFTDGQEINFNTGNANGWTLTAGSAPGRITQIADRSFFFHHGMGVNSSGNPGWHLAGSAGWHIEIPERVYPKELDPNPLALVSWGQGFRTTSTNLGYASPRMVGRDGTTVRFYELYGKVPGGGIVADSRPFNDYIGSVDADKTATAYNQTTNNLWWTEVVLSRTHAADEYTLARSRLRNMRAAPDILPLFQLYGSEEGNQWFNIQDYVLLPWDGARLPRNFVLEF